jgi:hypothetical protein
MRGFQIVNSAGWLLAGALTATSAIAAELKAPPARPTVSELVKASKSADWCPLDPQNTIYMELPGGGHIELCNAPIPVREQQPAANNPSQN